MANYTEDTLNNVELQLQMLAPNLTIEVDREATTHRK